MTKIKLQTTITSKTLSGQETMTRIINIDDQEFEAGEIPKKLIEKKFKSEILPFLNEHYGEEFTKPAEGQGSLDGEFEDPK